VAIPLLTIKPNYLLIQPLSIDRIRVVNGHESKTPVTTSNEPIRYDAQCQLGLVSRQCRDSNNSFTTSISNFFALGSFNALSKFHESRIVAQRIHVWSISRTEVSNLANRSIYYFTAIGLDAPAFNSPNDENRAHQCPNAWEPLCFEAFFPLTLVRSLLQFVVFIHFAHYSPPSSFAALYARPLAYGADVLSSLWEW